MSSDTLQGNALLHVVAAIVCDDSGRVLLSKRPAHKHQGGLWEFPGGKVEPEESSWQALVREIQEEIGLNVVHGALFETIQHDYPDQSVLLEFWRVDEFDGEALGMEGQMVEWARIDELHQYSFPVANQSIVAALQKRAS